MRRAIRRQFESSSRRPGLTGVSLLVLVALAMGASVSRADLALLRSDMGPDRIAVVATSVQTRAARAQPRQDERPAAVRAARALIAAPSAAVEPVGDVSPVVALPRLREALLSLPPPHATV